MKKWILYITIVLSLCSSVAIADNLADGTKALEKGNYAQAMELLRPLAVQGNAQAQLLVGSMYSIGTGVTQDYQKALKWFLLAAAQNDTGAQYNLGDMYEMGNGVTQDYQEALKWYRLAAEQGSAVAQYSLGSMYASGNGVAKDQVRSLMWLTLSAGNGLEEAKEWQATTAKTMTPSQIANAKKMAQDCEKNNYKNCE